MPSVGYCADRRRNLVPIHSGATLVSSGRKFSDRNTTSRTPSIEWVAECFELGRTIGGTDDCCATTFSAGDIADRLDDCSMRLLAALAGAQIGFDQIRHIRYRDALPIVKRARLRP